MKTLYDLLGALPHDDAEALRTAFRRAVKGAHPDIRPGDPDAALKFREIVRANQILGDAELREAYDHLLDLARLEQESASSHALAARIHRLASGVIALAGASAVTVGGYLLFMHMSAASIAPANNVDVTRHASSGIAAVSAAGSQDTSDKSAASPEKIEGASNLSGAAVPRTNAEIVPAANIGPTPDLAASEARSLRARRPSAYHDGDRNGSIAGLDQADRFGPRFMPAYIDRGIIFFRLRKFDRAFADISRAKRIEMASRSKSAPTVASKPRFDQAAIAPPATPLPRRRTAAPDSSRGEGLVSLAR